jgi:hypothetical protein
MPIASTLIVGAAVAGVGLSAAGMVQSHSAAKQQASAQKDMIAEQQKQEAIRQRAMELDARRRSLEAVRQQQRARSLALTTTTAQGANQSSGAMGAFGQVSGQSNTNLTGIQQQLGFGREMFASNALLSQARMNSADAQSSAALGAGMSSLGGAIISSLGPIGNLSGNLRGTTFGQSGGMVGTSSMYQKA